MDAFALRADGYLLKPVTEEDVHKELNFILEKRAIPSPESKHCIRIQCFGNFEVFADEEPIRFARSKTKELLAYLVDREGATVSMGELMAVLWEDAPESRSTRSNVRNIIHDLKATLAAHGADEVLTKSRNAIALNRSMVDCDFYDFLQRMPYAVNLYHGEYMNQYSWAEITAAHLIRQESTW